MMSNKQGDNTMTADASAFVMGFLHGLKTKKSISRRQIEARFPHFSDSQVTCYHNGHDDGVQRDSFRYDLVRKAEEIKQRNSDPDEAWSDLGNTLREISQ